MNQRKVAIIGRGISGLSCGIRLLEKGYIVDIYSKDVLVKTTSMSAGAFWWPYNINPLDKVKLWARTSYQEYKNYQSDKNSGITFQKCLRFCEEQDETVSILAQVEDWSYVNGADYGIKCDKAYSITLPVIDVPTYMPYLEQKYIELSGKIFIRKLDSVDQLFDKYDIVVNCCGVEAYNLVNDKRVFPIKGQVLSVAKQKNVSDDVRLVMGKDNFTMILPRLNDCLLGGTAEIGNWSLKVDAKQAYEFRNRCEKILPELKDAQILSESVGLRPGRDEIRLELENSNIANPVIHNYGHGGGGYTVAWGCADDVVSLVESC